MLSKPTALTDQIWRSLVAVYGPKAAESLMPAVEQSIANARKNRPEHLLKLDNSRSSEWYKDEVVYMLYVDRFGLPVGKAASQFNDLKHMLGYLGELGITCIYLLPFMDSPMGDAGFDVRDYTEVRAELGGKDHFMEFMQLAKAEWFTIKSDLILNHVSDQHPWFQSALQGDEEKINYFVHQKEAPRFQRYSDPQRGIVIDYEEGDGSVSSRRLIFPDNTDTHWRCETIGGQDYYFYHTFYPFQLDINWKNPAVLLEMLDILAYWANIGVDIFRLDAIPYFIKEPGTTGENHPHTHAIIKLLSAFLQSIAPATVLQAEACQWPKDILPYFGEEQHYTSVTGKPVTRTDEVQIAYNFPYMPALWSMLLTNDNRPFIKAYHETPDLPDSAAWAIFLRVHDELTLEMVDQETRSLLYTTLVSKGAQFRQGLGVSGRLANFLDNNPDRIALAFHILLTMPGLPIIYYGDEIGAQNNWYYAQAFACLRESCQLACNPNLEVLSYFDTRDINRAPLFEEELIKASHDPSTFAGELFITVQNLVRLRKETPVLTRGDFRLLEQGNRGLFAYSRQYEGKRMLIAHNLGGSEQVLAISRRSESGGYVVQAFKHGLMNILGGDTFSARARLTFDDIEIPLNPYQSKIIPL